MAINTRTKLSCLTAIKINTVYVITNLIVNNLAKYLSVPTLKYSNLFCVDSLNVPRQSISVPLI